MVVPPLCYHLIKMMTTLSTLSLLAPTCGHSCLVLSPSQNLISNVSLLAYVSFK